MKDTDIKTLIGLTVSEIKAAAGDDTVTITTTDGRQFQMYHSQNCCESVTVDEVIGDLEDLIGSPITVATEEITHENPPGVTKDWQDSFTWTTYALGTRKGGVLIRWYGESNGYYSESVSFADLTAPTDPYKY